MMETPTFLTVLKITAGGPGSLWRCGHCRRSLIGRSAIRPQIGPLNNEIFCNQTCADQAHANVADPEDRWR